MAAPGGLYRVDAVAESALKSAKPWSASPTWFSKVQISSAAAVKMLLHAASGVEKGRASKNGMPVEVMGFIVGHLSTDDEHTLCVTDAYTLAAEGTETAVVTDDEKIMNRMFAVAELVESTRRERFVGWYHSHPFDVGQHSNCFLSGTDVSTQLSWQRHQDDAGNPWLALVVDPLRGIAKGVPEIGAFRCYPATYTPPKGLAPDGVTWADERARNARWGESCVSYYQIPVEYTSSPAVMAMMMALSKDQLWIDVLSAAPSAEVETRASLVTHLTSAAAARASAMHMPPTSTDADVMGPTPASSHASTAGIHACGCHASEAMKAFLFRRRATVSTVAEDVPMATAATSTAPA